MKKPTYGGAVGTDACRGGGLAASVAYADVPAASTRRDLFRSPQANLQSVVSGPFQNSPNYMAYGIGQPSFNTLGNPLGLQSSPEFPQYDARGGYHAEHADDEEYWRDVESKLIANDGVSRAEQGIKGLRTIERFPKCFKAPELREWLLDVVTKVRNSCVDPIAAATWIREATSGSRPPQAAALPALARLHGEERRGLRPPGSTPSGAHQNRREG